MNDLHEYLRIASGTTAGQMWRCLEGYRRLKVMWPELPKDREAFEAGLAELEIAGLAKRTGDYWHWIPKPRVAVCEPKGDRMLFV